MQRQLGGRFPSLTAVAVANIVVFLLPSNCFFLSPPLFYLSSVSANFFPPLFFPTEAFFMEMEIYSCLWLCFSSVSSSYLSSLCLSVCLSLSLYIYRCLSFDSFFSFSFSFLPHSPNLTSLISSFIVFPSTLFTFSHNPSFSPLVLCTRCSFIKRRANRLCKSRHTFFADTLHDMMRSDDG
ncbi:unnamed protein product [Acanthosepion pharaonis]|uniref:Uncharacterized protein n=1 Tax=Acanthosepion pharaonis TaxID=158019 RepID=A0A812C2E2_ACAPH|nr:unnamed protein product [Sepia pharaonis]